MPDIDATDRRIALLLQEGFPLVHSPFDQCAHEFGVTEHDLMARLRRLLAAGSVTRFGPFYNAERMGGDFCLCAMCVPEELWVATVELVNARIEVAHNYRRTHALNMWFVLAVERASEIERVARKIELETALPVLLFPKISEFFLELKVNS